MLGVAIEVYWSMSFWQIGQVIGLGSDFISCLIVGGGFEFFEFFEDFDLLLGLFSVLMGARLFVVILI